MIYLYFQINGQYSIQKKKRIQNISDHSYIRKKYSSLSSCTVLKYSKIFFLLSSERSLSSDVKK